MVSLIATLLRSGDALTMTVKVGVANGKVGINEDDEIVHNVSLSFTFFLRQPGKLTELCE